MIFLICIALTICTSSNISIISLNPYEHALGPDIELYYKGRDIDRRNLRKYLPFDHYLKVKVHHEWIRSVEDIGRGYKNLTMNMGELLRPEIAEQIILDEHDNPLGFAFEQHHIRQMVLIGEIKNHKKDDFPFDLMVGLQIFWFIEQQHSQGRTVIPMVFQDGQNFETLVKLHIQHRKYQIKLSKAKLDLKHLLDSQEGKQFSHLTMKDVTMMVNGNEKKAVCFGATVGSEKHQSNIEKAQLRLKTSIDTAEHFNKELMRLTMKILPSYAMVMYRCSSFIDALTRSFRADEIILLLESRFTPEELKQFRDEWLKNELGTSFDMGDKMARELEEFYLRVLDEMIRVGLLQADLSLMKLVDCHEEKFQKLFQTLTVTDRIMEYLFVRDNEKRIKQVIESYQQNKIPHQAPFQNQQRATPGRARPLQPMPERKPLREPVGDIPCRVWENLESEDGFVKIEAVQRGEWLDKLKSNRVIIPPKSHHHALSRKHRVDVEQVLGVDDFFDAQQQLMTDIRSEQAIWERTYSCKNGDQRFKVTLRNELIVILQLTSESVLTFCSMYPKD